MIEMREDIKNVISRELGLNFDQIIQMSVLDEIEYIQEKKGMKIAFSKKRDLRKIGRGNPLLARRRIRTLFDVERKLRKAR